MMNSIYDFSILIPSWNNLPYLQWCIGAIRKNSSTNVQIIVIANEGKDGTVAWLQQQSDIDFIHFNENAGICIGLNACRELIKGKYIIYLNDDMYVCPNWDKYLWDETQLIGHEYFMLSGTMIEPRDTGNSCVIVQDYGDNLDNFDEQRLLNEFAALYKEDWSGSTWPPNVVPISLWDKVGGLSVEFSPGMYSDPDFSMKLYSIGVRYFKGVSKSRVYHFGSKSTKRVKQNKGRKQFLSKWYISANFFMKKYLKIGIKYNGPIEEYKLTLADQFVNWLKRLF